MEDFILTVGVRIDGYTTIVDVLDDTRAHLLGNVHLQEDQRNTAASILMTPTSTAANYITPFPYNYIHIQEPPTTKTVHLEMNAYFSL